MAPSKPRAAPEDTRSETSSTREKLNSLPNGAHTTKGRRATTGVGAGSSLRDTTAVGAASSAGVSGPVIGSSQESNQGMQWSTIDTNTLHSYRHAYKLNTPPAFSNEYNHLVLSRPGIGHLSPTMARKKDQRRQSREQLTNAVRKHFNSLGIQENEAIVDFLYKVKWQDKNFRMRFTPSRPR